MIGKISNNVIAALIVIFMITQLYGTWLVFEMTRPPTKVTSKAVASLVTCLNYPPELHPIGNLNATENITFIYDVNVTDLDGPSVLFSDNSTLFNISDTTGLINFTHPDTLFDDDVGLHVVMITVTDGSECQNNLDYEIINFTLLPLKHRPNITSYYPSTLIGLNISEEGNISFNVSFYDHENRNAYTPDDENLTVVWYLDDVEVQRTFILSSTIPFMNESRDNYTYIADYSSAGMRNFTVVVNDSYGLSTQISWLINITNVNRPPYFNTTLSSQQWEMNRVLIGFDGLSLDNFTYDPDLDDNLTYTAVFTEPAHYINVNIDPITHVVTFSQPDGWSGSESIYFVVEDKWGASNVSNVINLTVEYIPPPPEQLQPSPPRGGGGGGGGAVRCIEEWYCTPWGICNPNGTRQRRCYDLNNCRTTFKEPAQSESCVYVEQCYNGLQDQNEEGIDCGGPCPPCGTCFDRIQNQGEEGIDCGGPCPPCGTCYDGIQNQGEDGIDCGGPCPPCAVVEEVPPVVEKPIPPAIIARRRLVWLSLVLMVLMMAILVLTYRYYWPYILQFYRRIPWIVYRRRREEERVVIVEEEKVRESVLAGLEKIEKQLYQKSPEELSRKFSAIMRQFFKDIFNLEYEFTYEELRMEVSKRKISPTLKEILMSYSKRISEIEYGGYKITREELYTLVEEAREIVKLMTKPTGKEKGAIKEEQKKERREEIVNKIRQIFKKERLKKDVKKVPQKPVSTQKLVYGLIKEALSSLKDGDIRGAEKTYYKALKIYNKLAVEDKKKVYGSILRLYDEIKLSYQKR
jgi:hypothetical protein